MNEMLSSLGFGRVTNSKWTNGENMEIRVDADTFDLRCHGYITDLVSVGYFIESSNHETMKRHVEKFMRMVGKCIQVDEE